MVLRQIPLHAPAYVMPEPQILISNARELFDENGDLVDEQTRERMRRFLDTLVEWTERLTRHETICERSYG
jgi:chromate reductase